MRVPFSEVPSGKRFTYNGRVYLKLRLNLASDQNQMLVMFPSDTVVEHFPEPGEESAHQIARFRFTS